MINDLINDSFCLPYSITFHWSFMKSSFACQMQWQCTCCRRALMSYHLLFQSVFTDRLSNWWSSNFNTEAVSGVTRTTRGRRASAVLPKLPSAGVSLLGDSLPAGLRFVMRFFCRWRDGKPWTEQEDPAGSAEAAGEQPLRRLRRAR